MCSIAGIISSRPYDPQVLKDMHQSMQHRGPDGEGFYHWDDGQVWVQLAHNRLAILDPTPSSDQPFHYLNRYVLVYNGEIYNYKELKETLRSKGYAFSTSGDTEVVAAAFDAYGSNCLQQFDGMFSFGIWDQHAKRFFAGRDRFGEKPFYYHYDEQQGTLFFASEIKGLRAAGMGKEPNHQALYNYLTLGYTKQVAFPDNTFFSDIFQLPPAHHLVYDGELRIERYWDLDKETIEPMTEAEALIRFEELLHHAVDTRLRSDVKTGTSLSGGLDSSSIAALCSSSGNATYSHHAFSAVFPGFEKDESVYIKQVANQFHLQVHAVTPTATTFASHLQKLIHHQEEPFGSASVFAQYAVFEAAKNNGVKVLLDGQGADEALAGYIKYTHWYLQEMIGIHGWKWADAEAEKLKQHGFLMEWNWKNRIAAAIPSVTTAVLERKTTQLQRSNSFIHKGYADANTDRFSLFKPIVEKLNDIQYFDLMVMGLQELLRYADRNSMAHGVEVRLPFLSQDLVQFVLSAPPTLRIKDGYTKWILRKTMDHKLPDAITWRQGKTGFEPPQELWMKDPVVMELIREGRKKLVALKILDASVIDKPLAASAAHAADNFDFRCMIAGHWIN
jgi:asparagine synthase (glutamine-hydrolysing)